MGALLIVLVVAAGIIQAACARPVTTSPSTTEVKIAGGRTIPVPMTAEKAPPAANERLEIQLAGPVVAPSAETKNQPNLVWEFALRVKDGQPPKRVVVEDVTADPIVRLVIDEAPRLDRQRWAGQARPIHLTAENTAWVFDPKPTVKVFRFTVLLADGSESVLHQAASFPEPAKTLIRTHADKIRSGR